MKYDEDSVLTQSKKRRVYKWIEKIRTDQTDGKSAVSVTQVYTKQSP